MNVAFIDGEKKNKLVDLNIFLKYYFTISQNSINVQAQLTNIENQLKETSNLDFSFCKRVF